LDIGAISPEEIALSILAEIIQLLRRPAVGSPGVEPDRHVVETPAFAKDPVCGMTVEVSGARYTSQYGGETYFFCAKSCQTSFERDPEKYLQAIGG
jgi:xanthine dehydrogenase accessory factor